MSKTILDTKDIVKENVERITPLVSTIEDVAKSYVPPIAAVGEAFLQEIKGGIINGQNKINYVFQEVQLLKNKFETLNDPTNIDLPNSHEIKANVIDPESLREPEFSDGNRRGKNSLNIYKKSYKQNDVACKYIKIQDAATQDIQQLQKEYALIIISAWQGDSALRASLQQIFLNLCKLASTYYKPGTSQALLPEKTLDLDGSNSSKGTSISDKDGMDLPDIDMDFDI
ncbi:4888_t:CDS:2, partial [Gigaspora rosea]